MAEYKKQHFVPKFYLKNFTRGGKTFSVYNIAKDFLAPSVPYDTQCYKNYYYGKDLIWESQLSKMETEWGVVFQKVLRKEDLSAENIFLIKQFALYQLQRTVAFNDYSSQQRETFLCEIGRLLYKSRGLIFDSNAANSCKERASKEITPAENLALAAGYVLSIQDLDLAVIEYKGAQDLITSDVPVVAINPFHKPSIEYHCMGLIILFPISSNFLVVLYDAKMYPKYRGQQYLTNADENEVYNLNVLQFCSADKILISKSARPFSEISDAAITMRTISRNQEPISFLGTDNNRLLVPQPRKVVQNCKFSFGEINSKFTNIPFVCREAPPRRWDLGWENKLKIKENILPTVISLTPELRSEYNLTKDEICTGCQLMASAAKDYWSQ